MEMDASGSNRGRYSPTEGAHFGDDKVRTVSVAFPFVGPGFWAGFWIGILVGGVLVGALMTAMFVVATRVW